MWGALIATRAASVDLPGNGLPDENALGRARLAMSASGEAGSERRSGLEQRIDDGDPGEAAKVTVCRPQLVDAMLPAQRCHPGIVDAGTDHLAGREEGAQGRPVARRFAEERDGRRLQPRVDLIERTVERSWRHVDAGVGDDGEKLMQARPWDRPGLRAFGERGQPLQGGAMKGRVLTMGIDENVGIDCNQLPRPS